MKWCYNIHTKVGCFWAHLFLLSYHIFAEIPQWFQHNIGTPLSALLIYLGCLYWKISNLLQKLGFKHLI